MADEPFATIVPLPENRSALAAARDLFDTLQTPGPTIPLLFLHGPSGVGKSLLVHALAEALPLRQVCTLTGGNFPLPNVTDEDPFPAALATKKPTGDESPNEPTEDESGNDAWPRLKEARRADLLIVEDLQHLPLRAGDAFVNLLDTRQRRQLPTVATALVGPRHLAFRGHAFPARLTNRLAGGLVVAIDPLPVASRLALLQTLAERIGLDLDDDVMTWLAEHLIGGGRQLQGSLNQIATLQKLQRKPLTLEQIRQHFQGQIEAQAPTVERIVAHVGGHYQVKPSVLRSAQRSKHVVLPRQVSMYLARQLTPLSLQQIGKFFGGRDHTTVMHACKKIEEALQTDLELGGTVRQMSAELS
jgi:chromosomal replication initiator protein